MSDSRVLGIGNGVVSQMTGTDIAKRQNEATEVMFADVISMGTSFQSENRTFETADGIVRSASPDKAETRRENASDVYEKYQYKEKTICSESKTEMKQDAEKTEEELAAFKEGVAEVLQEELHVTEEEIEEAMEALGLQFLDLLDASNLANLVVKLDKSENVNQLLCSEAFTNVLQKVNELGKEMIENLQMTVEELQNAVSLEAEGFTEWMEQTEVEKTPKEVAVKPENDVSQDMKTETGQKDSVKETIVVEDFRAESDKSGQMDMKNGQMTQDDMTENESFIKADEKQKPQSGKAQVGENATFDTTLTGTTESRLGSTMVESLPSYVSVADIMEQFVEHTKVTLSAEVTKMEMQLNPEHLGKLYLEITESEGAVTAKIQTQNAIVKEALEMQIADLKQNLSQAGVKVDAIEVTIASHEFERNLEQDENSSKQQEEMAQKQVRHRSINLNSMDEMPDMLSEEEELAAKMMAEQGNRVDLTA